MRVSTAGKPEEYNAEIKRGQRPGEIAEEILVARFGVLKSAMAVPTTTYALRVNACLRALHNFFIMENPAYAPEYVDVRNINLSPEEVPVEAEEEEPPQQNNNRTKSKSEEDAKELFDKLLMMESILQQRNVTASIEVPQSNDWMSILRMDDKFLAKFERKVRMQNSWAFPIQDPHDRLVATLSYLATGEGYDVRLVDMFDNTFECIFKALRSYFEVRNIVQAFSIL